MSQSGALAVSGGGGGGVTSVSGTLNRITSTGGTTPVIDISANYVGQSSITTLGTITTGTWNGTVIGPTFGGTGQSTYTTGDILYASAANTLSKLAVGSNTQVLTLAGGVPTWAAPATSGTVTSVSGTANRITSTGGTTPVIDISASYVGQSSITTLGTITTGVWNGTAIDATHGGTAQTTYATGDILYASAANTLSKLAAGSNTNVLTLAAGIPSWAAPVSQGGRVVSQAFTSTGAFTYTPTSGMVTCIIELVGAGGASGGSATTTGSEVAGAGGGGGGSYLKIRATAAQIGANAPGSVGTGGTAGTAGNNPGNAGGNTTITIGGGTTWTAAGGSGGIGSATSAGNGTSSLGGAGNTNTTGTNATLMANIQGKNGESSFNFSTSFVNSGIGGIPGGGYGQGGVSIKLFATGSSTGAAPHGVGGGAGGSGTYGSAAVAGTAGANGFCLITEFLSA